MEFHASLSFTSTPPDLPYFLFLLPPLSLLLLFLLLLSPPPPLPLVIPGGKMNFMGMKRWLDYQLDENVESDLSSNVKYVLCLDALAGSEDKENIYLHVSKPPKEGSTGHS